ncbi:XK-related protein 8-like [Silurus meridionalis]|nr:XK-related protein 8-like [Silurus meridionalis]
MKEKVSVWFLALDILAALLSLLLFFWNVAANVWATLSFYYEQKYLFMGVFLFLIISSSVLLQIFSWLWYSDSSEKITSNIERFMKEHELLGLVHILQLGVFLRCLGMLELSISRFKKKDTSQNQDTESLSYDLSTLGLFKAFSESAPQIVLMTTNIIQMEDCQPFTVIKILSSLSSLSFTVLSYHRTMCAFVPEKLRMGWTSSIIYFLWNLLLIGPRVMCVSLFASTLPCYVPAHFLSVWMLLVIWVWWQNTDLMNNKDMEWLNRATVGLIWYFSWLNVNGKHGNKNNSGWTKYKGTIYNMVIGMDMMLLLGLYWWRRSVESARLSPLPLNLYLLLAMLMFIYIIGVLLKMFYYWKFHSKQPDLWIDEKDEELQMKPQVQGYDIVDSSQKPESALTFSSPTQRSMDGLHKRMRYMAVNFYC